MKKSIRLNAVLNGIRTILNLVFPLITFPYISRTLTVNEIGKYNFSDSIVQYFMLIAALGIDKYAIREGAKYRDDRKKISTFASNVFTVNLVSTIISYIILAVVLIISNKLHYYLLCILILSSQIFFTTIGTEWLYSIYEEYTYITIRSIVFKIISIALLFVFVRQSGDYLKYAAVTVFASVGSNILNFIHARKFCDIRLSFNFNWKAMLKPIVIIFVTNIAIQIYVNSDTTMLGLLKDDYTVGIYSVSGKIYRIVKNVLAAVLIVSIPRFSMYAGKRMQHEFDSLLLKLVNTLLVIIFPTMVGLFMLSRDVVFIISGSKYEQSTSSLRILCIAIIFAIFSSVFNECVLLPYKREKYSLYSSIVSAALNIGLNFIFIPLFAENGAALTTVLAEFTMSVMNLYFGRDLIAKVFINKTTRNNVISIAIGCGGIVLACSLCIFYINNIWLEILGCIITSITMYGTILLACKNSIAQNVFRQIKSRIYR